MNQDRAAEARAKAREYLRTKGTLAPLPVISGRIVEAFGRRPRRRNQEASPAHKHL